MEIDTAVRRHLLNHDSVTGYTQQKVFRWRLEQDLQPTGGRACVVSRQTGWAAPDPVNTAEFPIVWVDCYADPTRDEFGNITAMDAPDKAFALARVVEPILHGKRGQVWGAFGSNPGLMVISCARWQEPRLITAGDRHADEPPLGDMVFVRTVWAVAVAAGQIA